MKKHALALSFLGLFQALPAHADVGPGMEQLLAMSLEDLMKTKVRISTNTEQTLPKAPSVVSVITADDIKATGATNLTEILQSVPGVYVRANLFGFRPQVTFRGAGSTQTLLMLNGEPVRDLVWSSGIFWKGLPTEMIDRVEIIRGPGSALFGSEASAGVINVITKTAGRIAQSEAGARAGAFGSQSGWVQHGTDWNGIDIGFTAEMSHTNGHDPVIQRDGQTVKDAATGTRVSYAPGNAHFGYNTQDVHFSAAKDNWKLLADFLRHDHVETGLTGGAVIDPLTRGSDSQANVALLYSNEAFAKDWGMNAELRFHHLDYDSGNGFQENPPYYKDTAGGGAYPAGLLNQQRSGERGFGGEVSGLYRGFREHAIRLGGGFRSDRIYLADQRVNFGKNANGATIPPGSPLVDISNSPYSFAPLKGRGIHYFFMQDVWAISRDWELTLGARYDHYSDFGGTLNPRLALVWQTTDRLVTKLMHGRAFRAPSFLELYSYTAATRPNPNLKPERSRTWDLAFSFLATRDLTLGLDFYQFEQSNLIVQDAAGMYQNANSTTAHGVELEAQWQATKTLRISANRSVRNETVSFNPNYVPKQKNYLRADWAFMPNWNWDVQASWIGMHSPPPATNPQRAAIGAYTLVDSTIRYQPRKEWELAASIRNLFDVDVREFSSKNLPDNLPLPRRSVYAEVRYKF